MLSRYFLSLSLLMLMFVSCSDASFERHYSAQRQRVDLSGEWNCSLGQIFLPSTIDESRLAPLNTDSITTASLTRVRPFVGKMKYFRQVNIPKSFEGKHITLIMERTKKTTLWIDGDSIGTCGMLLSSQVYDLSGKLKTGEHIITIEVDNSDITVPKEVLGSHAWSDATQTNWNGVVGDFYLEATSQKHISDVQIFPDIKNKKALVRISLSADKPFSGEVTLEGFAWNTLEKDEVRTQYFPITVKRSGENVVELMCDMGKNPLLWSEFSPALYKMNVTLDAEGEKDNMVLDFGMRDFFTSGTCFSINGLRTFLRGVHDGCVFPLTGYPPMNVAEWTKYFDVLKKYGFNHVRFHSWTPPMAAFRAADMAGFYLEAELPVWGGIDSTNVRLSTFLENEGIGIMKVYGNQPSFTMFSLGNELYGQEEEMLRLTELFRQKDRRHLYSFGANNFLGTKGQAKGEDFFVTCRVGWDADSTYATHVRSSFSFADAYKGGVMNALCPSTDRTYIGAISHCSVPVVSHENGQWQVFPRFEQVKKYTGVLYPYNLMTFQKRMEASGMADQEEDFARVSGKTAAMCYKEDIEMNLRTRGMGGFQMLDIKDYPGQGTALVGMLDAMMDSKGIISAEKWSGFCSQIVPMAMFEKYTWSADETFKASIVVSNYSSCDISNDTIMVTIANGRNAVFTKKIPVSISQGAVGKVGDVSFPLSGIKNSAKLSITLKIGDRKNYYDVWVYKDQKELAILDDIYSTDVLDTKTMEKLEDGGKVLFLPSFDSIEKLSVSGMFTPDYWNFSMFKNISEMLKREVSPGTLSFLMNPSHPLFKYFPTEDFSSWQWWSVARNSRPFILDNAPHGYKPIIQVVDNVERMHRLGVLFEFAVGKGSVLVCTTEVDAIKDKVEGRAYYNALVSYIKSADFAPKTSLSWDEFCSLFEKEASERQIKGVENITSYK